MLNSGLLSPLVGGPSYFKGQQPQIDQEPPNDEKVSHDLINIKSALQFKKETICSINTPLQWLMFFPTNISRPWLSKFFRNRWSLWGASTKNRYLAGTPKKSDASTALIFLDLQVLQLRIHLEVFDLFFSPAIACNEISHGQRKAWA